MQRSLVLAFSVFASSCGGSAASSTAPPAPVFVDDAAALPVVSTVTVIEPATALDAARESSSAIDATLGDAAFVDDAIDESATLESSTATEAGPGGTCVSSLAPGALAIDELMIESVAGTGDDGEWIEVTSALGCSIDLIGLHGETPRGAQVATFDVVDHLWLPPYGTFVIADSSAPAINHYLPGVVIPWFGHPGDVLRNKGTSITLTLDGALIDTVTYPALTLTAGTSIAFPSDCDAAARPDWSQWQRSTSSWFPGFMGTPNAPNDDVHCMQ